MSFLICVRDCLGGLVCANVSGVGCYIIKSENVGVCLWKTEVYTVVRFSSSGTKNLKYSEILCSSVLNSSKNQNLYLMYA